MARRVSQLEATLEQVEHIRDTNARLLDRLMSELEAERARSHELLLNVLPQPIIDRLNAGDLVVFPFDQHAGRKDGVVVDFFGHPAKTPRAAADLALRMESAVVLGFCTRVGPGVRYRLSMREVPTGGLDALALTRAHRKVEGSHRAAAWRIILDHVPETEHAGVMIAMEATLAAWLAYRDEVAEACGLRR